MSPVRVSSFITILIAACSSPNGGNVGDPNPDAGGGSASPDAPPSHDVVITEIPELPGSHLYVRPDAIPAPGILMLHGSEGGSAPYIGYDAKALAEAGFAVVTFCWFDCPGKPNRIYHIPLEDTLAGLSWLRASSAVGGRKVGLFGWSRGGEQAVLLASLAPTMMDTVAVHAPSDTIVASYDPATDDGIYELDPATQQYIYAAAWTWQGTQLYGERQSFSQPGPRIRVEDYLQKLYLSHGEADTLWSVQRSRNIKATRDAAGLVTEAHFWPGQNHVLMGSAAQQFLSTMTMYYHQTLDQ
jgi:dienelactone hydrolase